jgi:hypothetical protein
MKLLIARTAYGLQAQHLLRGSTMLCTASLQLNILLFMLVIYACFCDMIRSTFIMKVASETSQNDIQVYVSHQVFYGRRLLNE